MNEMMTWLDALEFCWSINGSLANPTAELVAQSETDIVWTAVRFLDGKWYRLNEGLVGPQVPFPSCPVQEYHCGAYDIKHQYLVNQDCNDKHYFCCGLFQTV